MSTEAIERTFVRGRYRLAPHSAQALMSGPLAEVYHAQDVERGGDVALKRFLPQYGRDARFAIRFREQLKRLAAVQDAALVRIVDYGLDGDTFYIASEWVEGINLKTYLAEYGAFSPDAAVYVARQVCSGLAALHRQGLIHRGLKPENVFLTAEGRIKVADATLSQLASDSGLSKTTVMLGAVDYMSPEQARGRPAGPESDIYSLGVILFEMLTVRLPFEAADSWSVVRMHAQTPPPSPRQYNAAISPQLAAVVEKTLQKTPAERFESVEALDAALAPLPQGDELLWLITPRHAYNGATARLVLPEALVAAGSRLKGRVIDLWRGAQARVRGAELAARAIAWRERLTFGQLLLLQFLVVFVLAFTAFYLLSGKVMGSAEVDAAGVSTMDGVRRAQILKDVSALEATPTLAPVRQATATPLATSTATPPEATATLEPAPVQVGPAPGSNGGGNPGGGPPPHAGPPGGPPGQSGDKPGRGRGRGNKP